MFAYDICCICPSVKGLQKLMKLCEGHAFTHDQGWKLKPKPKHENPVLKEILETQTETDTCLAKILKT